MIWALVMFAAVLLGLVVWQSDLPLRSPYLTKKSEREYNKDRLSSPFGIQLAMHSGQKQRLSDKLFLADMTAEEARRQRTMLAIGGIALLGGGALVFLPPVLALAVGLLGGLLGWLSLSVVIRSKATAFQFEMLQALPQFLSLVAIGMTSLSLQDSIRYAAHASDHRTFMVFRGLIPPPNSASTFGDELFEFGRKYNIPEFTVRGNILITTAREGGRNVRGTIQEQATICREGVNTQIEEDVIGRVTQGAASSMAIIMGVFAFILWPVSQQLSQGLGEGFQNPGASNEQVEISE